MSTTRRVRLAAAASAALAMALTGCGVAGTSFQPGVAADVNGTTVSGDRVDQLVGSYCEAIAETLAQQGTVVPLGYFRSGTVGQLALVSAAEQLAEEQGVEPTQDYARLVATIESQTPQLTDEQREAVVEIEGAATYVQAVQLAVGQKLLAEEGQAEPGQEAALQRGTEELNAWLEEHDVQFNPEFGITLEDGAITPVDSQLAFPVSETAKTAGLAAPDQDYAQGLPSSQSCE